MITLDENSYMGTVNKNWNGNIHIGKFCSIANDITFLGQACEHPPVEYKEIVSTFPFCEKFGNADYPSCTGKPINIGNDVWIGEKAFIIDGVTIGNGAIIGACSVVTKDVPDYAIMAGNPARLKRFRFEREVIEKLNKIKWWNWDEEIIRANLLDFLNINSFIEKYEQKN